nr:immunoglobulin heavy chain junction region [Macaca mulatta]
CARVMGVQLIYFDFL